VSNNLVTLFYPELSDLSDHVVLRFLPFMVLNLDFDHCTTITGYTITDSSNLSLKTQELTELSFSIKLFKADPRIADVTETLSHHSLGT
jgi:hypothetical protein